VTWWVWLAVVCAAAWLLAVGALLIAGRRTHARALAGFLPDCALLLRRLARDRRVPRRQRVMLVLAAAYVALPFDLVPDFIPIAGQLDDAVVLALALRGVVRSAGSELVAEHWPGPASSCAVVLRLAGS
jgi:uncharacterized membrane protein YkvA (DUF1232 family)